MSNFYFIPAGKTYADVVNGSNGDGQYNIPNSSSTSGQSYNDLISANPYTGVSVNPTIWDKLGWSNKTDQINAQLRLAEKEYNANIAQQEFNNIYNSPEATAQRMRDAGLNPNLQGVTGHQSAFGDLSSSTQFSKNMPESIDPMDRFNMFANTIMQTFNIANSIYRSFAENEILANQASQASVQTNKDIFNFAEMVASAQSASEWSPDSNPDFANDLPKFFGLGNKSRDKKLTSSFVAHVNSPKFLSNYYRWRKEGVQNRIDLGKISSYDFGKFDEDIFGALSVLGELRLDAEKASMIFNKSKSSFDSKYYDKLSPDLMAKSHNMDFSENYDSKKFSNDLRSASSKMVAEWRKKAEKGSKWHQALLLSFYSLGTNTFSNLTKMIPSF